MSPRIVWLDWTPDQFGLEPNGSTISFDCFTKDGLVPFHHTANEMRAAFLAIADCVRCNRTLVRPSKTPPTGMAYRWGQWQYRIEEEP